ncbi:MAG: carboxypeptidase regulatory-like domain-containing protein [Terriglobia bacterium]
MRDYLRRFLSWGTFLFLLFLVAGVDRLPAQVIKGSISGTVIDQSGGAVPDAEIRAVNAETNLNFTVRSEASGAFKLALLPIGTYRVEVSKEGFKKFAVSNVVVSSATDNGLGMLQLEVGALTTVIEVAAEAPLLQTTQAQISTAVKGNEIAVFPSVGENQGLDRLMLMLPGVVDSRDGNFSNTNGASFAVNGIRGRNNDQQLDGQANNDNSVGGPSIFVGNTDFVEEYQAVTNNFGPEYGRNAGSVVNIVTKSGTNNWHGTVTVTEANSALSTLDSAQKSFEDLDKLPRYNEIFHSYSGGGPIIKDKLFVFGGFDHDYLSQSQTYSTGSLTPTPAGLDQMAACSWANANSVAAIRNYGPFGITGGNPIITGAPELLTFTNPLDGTQTCDVEMGGVQRTLPTGFRGKDAMARIDVQTDKNRIYGRWYYQPNLPPNADSFGRAAVGYPVSVPSLGQGYGLSWTRTFSGRMVNEFRVNYGRISVEFGTNTIGDTIPSMLNIDQALANINLPPGYADYGPLNSAPQGRIVNTYQLQDNWSYIVGRHQLKAGFNWTHQRSGNRFLPNVNGTFNYPDFDSYMANIPSSIQIASGNPVAGFKEHQFFAYVGDDFKVTPNLTLNLGLTWSYFSQPSNFFNDVTTHRESNDATAFWDPSLDLSIRTVPRLNNIKTDFGPSIGFAYTPKGGGFLTGEGRTVIRGGYRLSYDPPFYNMYLNMMSSAPIVLAQTVSGVDVDGNPVPGTGLPAAPFGPAVRDQFASFLTFGVSDPRRFSQTGVASDFRTDRVQSWSFGIQREIGAKTVFEARYIGNHGDRLFQSINENPRVSTLFADFPDSLPSGVTPCTDSTAPGYRRADCNLGIRRLRTNTGYSDYHALQTELRATKLANQLTLRTAYTWSKTTDNVSEIFGTNAGGNTYAFSQDPFDYTGAEHGLSGLDRPHTWTLSFHEEIPTHRDQRGVAGKILGGWAISGTYALASGETYTPVQFCLSYCSSGLQYNDVSFANTFIGTYETSRPYVSNPSAPEGKVGIYAGDACGYSGGYWECSQPPDTLLLFNSMNTNGIGVRVDPQQVHFIVNAPTANSIYGSPWGTAARNSLRDAITNVGSFAVYKDTRITERVSVQWHMSMVNVFNHPNFYSVDPFIDDAGLATEYTGFADPSLFNGTTSSLGQRQIRFGLKFLF